MRDCSFKTLSGDKIFDFLNHKFKIYDSCLEELCAIL